MDMSIIYISVMRIKPPCHCLAAGFHYHCDAKERGKHTDVLQNVWYESLTNIRGRI